MSEYEYDKNKPGQAANTADDPVSGTGSSDKAAAPQSRRSVPDDTWENDDWSMRSSSVDEEDDPLIKLARLMEQNERNFEAAAQRPDGGSSTPPQQRQTAEARPGGGTAGPQDSGMQPGVPDLQSEPQSEQLPEQQPEPARRLPDQNLQNHQPSQDEAAQPALTADAGAPSQGPAAPASAVRTDTQSARVEPSGPENAPETGPETGPEPRQPVEQGYGDRGYRDQGYRDAPRQERILPASDLSAQAEELQGNPPPQVEPEKPAQAGRNSSGFASQSDEQIDPFAPGGSSRPLPERDFDVSRIPRAIRPAVPDNHSRMGGLHGQASPDLTAPQPPATPPSRPELPRSRAADAAAARPNPLTAELTRYADATGQTSGLEADTTQPGGYSPQPEAGPATAPQQPETAVPPAEFHQEPDLTGEPAPQPDFSYLREVEDLRVPAREIRSEQPDEEADLAAGAYADPAVPTEEADILYEGYDDYHDERGGLFASRGMVIAAGVLAFVLLGGGALLAFQAIFSSDDGGPPPLVLADKSPVRMLPDGQAADTSGNGDIALTDESNAANGVIQPGAETPIERINPNIDPDREVRQVGVEGNSGGGEGIAPRSVRTFKVNPDGSIVAEPAPVNDNNANEIQPRSVTTQEITGSDEPVTSGTDTASSGVPVPRPRPGSRAGTTNDSQARIATTDTSGRAALPVSPRVSVGSQGPTFNENAPSVQPSANSVPARVPSSETAVVAQAPASQPASQPAPASAAAGDFVVQVSSQRSEEAARSAYAGLQRRFPSVLGDLSPDIVRADLGSRGVFYRVRVGPMETRLAANDFCQSLKNAGGDCIVARR